MKLLTFILLSVFANLGYSVSLSVSLSDAQNAILPGAVVYLLPSKAVPNSAQTIAIMDQVDRQFKPHILTVQSGTKVSFPNSDSIKHHVYSFSSPKVFELPLYKGIQADPLEFPNTGLVELGCNVHDWMLGYILVVDTPYFAQTNAQGLVKFDLPADEYRLQIWHPRIQEEPSALEKIVNLQEDKDIKIVLASDLLPGHDEYEDDDEFSDYE